LGNICANATAGVNAHQPCDGATQGQLADGTTIPLANAADIVPNVGHNVPAQKTAVNGGRMNGFSKISGCTASATPPHACYMQYYGPQVPNLAALARKFVISDRTFELTKSPSWAGHLVVAAGTQDGFQGNNPVKSTFTTKTGAGW
jgi:phospholipase C